MANKIIHLEVVFQFDDSNKEKLKKIKSIVTDLLNRDDVASLEIKSSDTEFDLYKPIF